MDSAAKGPPSPAFAGSQGLCGVALSFALAFLPLTTLAQSSPALQQVPPMQQGGQAGPSGQGGQTPVSAEARLEALRHALIDKALKGPTRIRSAAWVDESGALRENVQINSEVTLRGIRMLSYLDQGAPEQTRLQLEAETSLRRLGARDCSTPTTGPRLKRHAALIAHVTPANGRSGYHFVPELGEEAQALLLKLFAADEAWVVTLLGPEGSAYEQALRGGDRHMPRASPYALRLSLAAGEAAKLAPMEQTMRDWSRAVRGEKPSLLALPVRVSLQLEDRSSGRILWRNEALINYPEVPVSMVRGPLPAELIVALELSLKNGQKALREALACEPLQFATTSSQADQFTLAAGSRVGLRAGDQLLLVDRTRFPGNMLEKGSLDKAALIEIQSVSEDQALARRVAGPQPVGLQGNLVAMPL